MKTINEAAIEDTASSRDVFMHGYDLFTSGCVHSMELEACADGSYKIRAQVEGSTGTFYQTDLTLAADGLFMTPKEFHCECHASCPGACRHLTAAMFEYNYQYEDEEEDLPDFQPKQSDTELKNLLDYYILHDRNQFCQEYGSGNVRLVPTLHLESGRESLELKIGTSQLYVVKDIGELIYNIKQMRYVSYGKKLAFTHSQTSFTKESAGIVSLLLELDNESEFSLRYQGWGYGNSQMRRSCTLSPAMLDRLMELYEGKLLHVDDQLMHMDCEIPVVRENPRLPLHITGTGQGGAQLEMDPVFLTEGSRHWYLLWNRRFYICTRAYYDQVKGFLKLMMQERLRRKNHSGYFSPFPFFEEPAASPSYFLSEQDFGAFSKNILPAIANVLDIQIRQVDFTSYEPQEAVFSSYLDKIGSRIECRTTVSYGTKEFNLAKIPAKEETMRDIRSEYQVRSILEQYFELSPDQQSYLSREEDSMLDFLEEGLSRLEAVSDIFATDRFKNMRIIPMPAVTAGISMKGRLLDISWDVEGMSAQETADILAAYRKKKKYHKLKTGEFLRMDENSLAVLTELVDGLHLTREQLKAKKAELPLYRSLYLDLLMKDNADYIMAEYSKNFKSMIRRMRSAEDNEIEVPAQLNAVLRPYQVIGFQWLHALSEYGFGGILADDMGLGKTLQVLAFLAAHPGTHTLVVCPASLVYNWESECQRFYPSARTAVIASGAAARQMQIADCEQYDILITSYDLLKRDIDLYENKYFDHMIIDEAQNIKNPSTQAAKSVRTVACGCRFALTGTPIENRLSELWSIFEFLMPGYLYTSRRFQDELERPITETKDETARIRLLRMIKPFILRRLKKDVLKELPDKIEKIIYAKMEGAQNELYLAREKQLLMTLSRQTETEFKTNKLQVLSELTALRQICCDPALLYENYAKDSAKTNTCMEVIENAAAGGHKILLFSQFSSMLDRLSVLLKERGLRTFQLTGKTKKEERRRLTDAFQKGTADVFLISLKAGGTGLNLTAADMVIHYDPWWNLAAQSQAEDRACRIGQQNKVTVLRLIMKGTIEERILKMQEDKKNLADSILTADGVSTAGLDKEQLTLLLCHGPGGAATQ